MESILYVSLGAIVGANARYLIGLWMAKQFGVSFPFGTLFVNSVGCFLIGFFNGLDERGLDINPNFRLMFTVGCLGAFTTFSAFGQESISMLRANHIAAAMMNVGANVFIGLIGVLLGLYMARFR